jgi:hypothetical protein
MSFFTIEIPSNYGQKLDNTMDAALVDCRDAILLLLHTLHGEYCSAGCRNVSSDKGIPFLL